MSDEDDNTAGDTDGTDGPDLVARVERLLGVEHFDENARARIVELGPEALAVVSQCATDARPGPHRLMRARAILALADWPDEADALAVLDETLAASDIDDRLRATIALGEMATDASVQRLADIARTRDSDLERTAAVRALQVTPASAGRVALQELATEQASPYVQSAIESALGDD